MSGTVVHVADGDTLGVDVHGDGTSTPLRVRMTDINEMELSSRPAARPGEPECSGLRQREP